MALLKRKPVPIPTGVPSWTVRAPEYADLLPAARRFFARLLAFDIACPQCGEVSSAARRISGLATKAWDPRISRFECRACHAKYTLGIVAWPVGVGQARVVPPDSVPDYAQAIRLTQAAGHEIPGAKQAYDGANVLVSEEREK